MVRINFSCTDKISPTRPCWNRDLAEQMCNSLSVWLSSNIFLPCEPCALSARMRENYLEFDERSFVIATHTQHVSKCHAKNIYVQWRAKLRGNRPYNNNCQNPMRKSRVPQGPGVCVVYTQCGRRHGDFAILSRTFGESSTFAITSSSWSHLSSLV